MSLARGALGVLIIIGICYLFSRERRAVPWRLVLVGLGLQVVLALFILGTVPGGAIMKRSAEIVTTFLDFSYQGSGFLFGSLGRKSTGPDNAYLAFQALPILIYFSAVMAALYHFGIMQLIVYGLARVLWKLLRVSGAEAMSVTADVFVGMTEAPLVIRPYIERMTASELTAVMAGGFATIAGTVLGVYMLFVGEAYAPYLLAASVMAAPAALVTAKLLVPETGEPVTAGGMSFRFERTGANLLDAIAIGVKDGLYLALNIAAMLIAFYSLIALVNWPLTSWFGVTLQEILGFFLRPFAWCLGVSWDDAGRFGSLLGTKLALNEWIAYQDLQGLITRGELSDRSVKIATFALCGFANIGSMGVIVGGISQLAPSRREDLARLAPRAMLAGALASCLTGAVAGMFFPA